jgi:hypothetical protein
MNRNIVSYSEDDNLWNKADSRPRETILQEKKAQIMMQLCEESV